MSYIAAMMSPIFSTFGRDSGRFHTENIEIGRQFSFVIFCALFTGSSVSQTVIDFRVTLTAPYGVDPVRTGINEYTLYGSSEYYYTITCGSMIRHGPFNAVLTISPSSNNHGTMDSSTYSVSRSQRYHMWGQWNDHRQKYTCRLNVFMQDDNQTVFHYITESEIHVNFSTEKYIYASSVGDTAYVGERVNTSCAGYEYRNRWKYIRQEYNNLEGLQTVLIANNQSADTCKWYDRRYSYGYGYYRPTADTVNHPIRKVITNLQLTLVPSNFAANSSMDFTCNSDPPRMMYWTIIGGNGDLFDVTNPALPLITNTTVIITQKPGETRLTIVEGSPGTNGITRVTCSTYDTDAFIVATAHLVSPERYENATGRCDHWLPLETDTTTVQSITSGSPTVQTTVSPEPSTELEGTTQQAQSSPRQTDPITRCDCEQCPKPTKNSSNSNAGPEEVLLNPCDSNYSEGINMSESNSLSVDNSYIGRMPELIVPILITTTSLFFLVNLCLLVVIWNHCSQQRRCKDPTKSQPSPTTTPASLVIPDDERHDNDERGCIPVGTVMHYNPVYIQSSTDEASDDSEVEEESSVYQNDELYTYANV